MTFVTLFKGDVGGINVSLTASTDANGPLQVSGSDMGKAVEKWFHSSEYEYNLIIAAEHKEALVNAFLAEVTDKAVNDNLDILLIDLIRRKFEGDPSAYTKLDDFCQRNNIPTERFTWSS
ncbi:MAG: hypothetical protein ABIS18_07525 [Actinomycetota bacterium]